MTTQNAPSEQTVEQGAAGGQETAHGGLDDLFERARRLNDRGRAFVLGRMLEAAKTDGAVSHQMSKAIDGALALDRPQRMVPSLLPGATS